jgi:glycerol kinase
VKAEYVAAIDQGTTSTRCIVFDHAGRLVSVAQREHRQIFPRPGWVEHDAAEIWRNVERVVPQAVAQARVQPEQIAALGIANQRETVVLWERRTGRPVGNAITWQDTRTASLVDQLAADGGVDRFRERCGLPLMTYFSGPTLRWMLQQDAILREQAERGELLFGTMETWLIWNLTGGPDGGLHITDVTNASRTMLMDITTLAWDDGAARRLPGPSGDAAADPLQRRGLRHRHHGTARVSIAAALGDQQAALFGQTCFAAGEAKCTYGTGAFLLLNTGPTRSARPTACSARSATGSATRSRPTRSRARSRSPVRSCSGSATDSD